MANASTLDTRFSLELLISRESHISLANRLSILIQIWPEYFHVTR